MENTTEVTATEDTVDGPTMTDKQAIAGFLLMTVTTTIVSAAAAQIAGNLTAKGTARVFEGYLTRKHDQMNTPEEV